MNPRSWRYRSRCRQTVDQPPRRPRARHCRRHQRGYQCRHRPTMCHRRRHHTQNQNCRRLPADWPGYSRAGCRNGLSRRDFRCCARCHPAHPHRGRCHRPGSRSRPRLRPHNWPYRCRRHRPVDQPPRRPAACHCPRRPPARHCPCRRPACHCPYHRPACHCPCRRPACHCPCRRAERHCPRRPPARHCPHRPPARHCPRRRAARHCPHHRAACRCRPRRKARHPTRCPRSCWPRHPRRGCRPDPNR